MTSSGVSPALQVPGNIDYTSKDYTAFMQSMIAYAQTVMPDWNTSSEGDMGVALLELFAMPLDVLSYYGDRISQEAYLPTATQRLSLLNIAQLLGYTVSNGTPAVGTVTFQTANPGNAADVPPGTQVASDFSTTIDSPVIYEVDAGQADYQVPGDGGTLTLSVTQGVTTTRAPIGTSNGLPGQAFQLPQTGIIDGSVAVYVQTSVSPQQWAYVQYLVDSGASDTVYTTYVDASGLTWIEFGDNINGLIPSQGLIIYATYRVGVGSAGNVAAGVVGELINPIDGVTVPLQADNITFQSSVMTGGSDPETNDQIRANAPGVFATQQRAVSLPDFQSIAQNVQGVTVANAIARHATSVSVYALGPDYQPASGKLQNLIEAAFVGKTMAGVSVTVAQPALIAIDVGAVTPAAPGSPVPPTTTTASGPSVTKAATGGTVAAGTYQVEVTYVTAQGETMASVQSEIVTTGSTSVITVGSPTPATDQTDPAAPDAVTGWYAYVTQANGSAFTRQQTVGSPTAIGTNLALTAPPSSSGAAPPTTDTSGAPVQLQVADNYLQTSVVQNVETALTALLQPPNVSFGQLLTVGEVYQTIMAVAGVLWVVVPVFTREDITQAGTANIQLRGSEVPTPGNLYFDTNGGF